MTAAVQVEWTRRNGIGGLCRVCHNRVGLTPNGTAAPHKTNRQRQCTGTGMEVLWVLCPSCREPTLVTSRNRLTHHTTGAPILIGACTGANLEVRFVDGKPQAEWGEHLIVVDAPWPVAVLDITAAIETPELESPDRFHQWWAKHVDHHAPTIGAKAAQYGSNSLAEMGRVFARARGQNVDDETALEIGCFLYGYGKIQRVADALLRGEKPSTDTWHDLMVYSAMALYIREHKTWP